jgi:hypothetical protein
VASRFACPPDSVRLPVLHMLLVLSTRFTG